MRIVVMERVGADRVRFRSAAGTGTAIWAGQPAPADGEFHVELDVPGELDWQTIELDPPVEPGLAPAGAGTAVTGVVEDMDEQGVLTIRLPDGYVLVDTGGEPPLGVVGRTVRLTLPDLTVTPYSV